MYFVMVFAAPVERECIRELGASGDTYTSFVLPSMGSTTCTLRIDALQLGLDLRGGELNICTSNDSIHAEGERC